MIDACRRPIPDDVHPQQRHVQLTDTEAMVIDGLKQLTSAIFRTQYKQLAESPRKNAALSPSKLGANGTGPATVNSAATSPAKKRLNLDEAMLEAEKFCAMVVQQIVSLDEEGNSHKSQLDVYHSVHKSLFQGGK